MIAVTTHSRTRSMRYTAPMLLAGMRIGHELRSEPSCERYANILAGPRELWTLTIWRDGAEMRRCMRGGAHGRVMWRQPYWLGSYWGMRWRPGPHTSGSWEGRSWQWPDPAAPQPGRPGVPEALPAWMKAALGQTVPLEQRKVAGTVAATYRLRVPPWRIPSAFRDLRNLRRAASLEPDLHRASLGLGTAGALYLLVVATSPEALDRLRARAEHTRFFRRWGERAWWSTWEPEAEFGQWDRRKMRDGLLAEQPLVVDVSLPAHPVAARQARAILRAQLPALDPASLEVLRLLTSELVANNVNHSGLRPTDSIGLQVRAKGDWIRVGVIDHGRPFEPCVPLSKSRDDESGWGLFMVDQLAHRWGVTDRTHERQVWFELRTPVPQDGSYAETTRTGSPATKAWMSSSASP